jgi:ribosomal protein L32
MVPIGELLHSAKCRQCGKYFRTRRFLEKCADHEGLEEV